MTPTLMSSVCYRVNAATTISRHVCRADALKDRCVLAEVRWRWTLKVFWAAACTERNLCAEPTSATIFLTSCDTGRKSYNFPTSHHATRKTQTLTPTAICGCSIHFRRGTKWF